MILRGLFQGQHRIAPKTLLAAYVSDRHNGAVARYERGSDERRSTPRADRWLRARQAQSPRRLLIEIIGLAILLALLIGLFDYWLASKLYPATLGVRFEPRCLLGMTAIFLTVDALGREQYTEQVIDSILTPLPPCAFEDELEMRRRWA